MTKQLTKAQIDALKVFLADYGVNVSVKRQSKPRTVGEVLSKSKWYRRPSIGRKPIDNESLVHSSVTEHFSFRSGTYYGDNGTVICGNDRTSYAHMI